MKYKRLCYDPAIFSSQFFCLFTLNEPNHSSSYMKLDIVSIAYKLRTWV